MINFEDWKKIELKTAHIISAERIENSAKLLKLIVSLGVENRQIIAGIGESYAPESLIGRQVIIVANLAQKLLMGFESQGMILAATDENNNVSLICPDKSCLAGKLIS